MVVVGKEARVDCLQLRPGRRLGIVVVRHPSHDVEVRLDVVLPRLAALNLDVTDTEGMILDVADIDRPELVPAPRRKRHCPWLARSRRRWQGRAEV